MTVGVDPAEPSETENGGPAVPEPLETLVEAIERLRSDGYVSDLFASPAGTLDCRACGASHDPEALDVQETVRFEGDSNPDDEAILLAVSSAEGCLGLFSAAFGPSTAAADVMALQRFESPGARSGETSPREGSWPAR